MNKTLLIAVVATMFLSLNIVAQDAGAVIDAAAGRAAAAGAQPVYGEPGGEIERLKLDVTRLVHVHGGSDPLDALLKAAGRQGTQ